MPMDELEARLAALELLAIERLALDPGPVLARLREAIAEGVEGALDGDERMVREQALQLVEDAQRRNLTFVGGAPAQNDG